LDQLVNEYPFALKPETRFEGFFSEFRFDHRVIRILAPTTFMNHSGRSVASCTSYFRIESSQILVVHDEIDLEPGVCRLKFGGGHGGHNGLRDIGKSLGTTDFVRLRIGVGHPDSASMVTSHVLSRPDTHDLACIRRSMDQAMQIMSLVISGELERAMHHLHTKDRGRPESG
ncbi:MAG: aminoacyl-tRNA hydrolase, partial [Gammaproteobacteria bacterium]|nr:aminoacyl-tRNA hydrolase [Gammaproteobacteria bacterium]